MDLIDKIGLVAALVLPLWNLPLIFRIYKRKSSQDISIQWALGVWVCLLFMAPSGFTSSDFVWRTFNIVNFISFTLVTIFVLAFRKNPSG